MKRLLLIVLLSSVASTVWGAGKITWFNKLEQAQAEARKTSKPIFIDCFADWCFWCHKLEESVYADPKFIKYMEAMVPLRINVEDNGEGTRLAQKYELSGLPTLLVISPEGELLNRIGGYLQTVDLIEDLNMITNLLQKEKDTPKNYAALHQLGTEYLGREMPASAEGRFKKILEAADATASQKESAQFSLGLTQFYLGRLDDSLATLKNYRTTYPQAPSNEDALLLLSEIYLEKESTELARDTIKEFLAKYPKSGNVQRAQEVLATIDAGPRTK